MMMDKVTNNNNSSNNYKQLKLFKNGVSNSNHND